MDDSFRVRVDKVFGSLTVGTSNLSSPLWCLTDDEIDKREWNREGELLDFDSKPCPPHIDGFFAKTLDSPKQLRSCIGLEEEEDEQLPLYMREVSVDTYEELPLTLQDMKRDPRANHEAAKLRLKEDDEAALKEAHLGSMPLNFKEDSNVPTHSSVPDYVRNPSKYTCYTLDGSDDMDEESNRKAYMDFLSLAKKRNDDSSANFQKLPTFNPRMKQQPAGTFNKQGIEAEQMQVKKTAPLSIVTVESDNAPVSAMEEDESSVADDKSRPGSLQKHGRRYRTRAITMDADE
ncbi:hypothetical protein RND71_034946 [Anisodus tanguticus]|uniref:U5 small nuclear ribonucleoprotein TSSC4 n=1 Tax=Anisodus tanguticus TaxID=243964 RepID=A0AAE1V1Q6_9SOLA|nr:hypothetical protein RND71_034946 [Anisodus tanguticus]